MLGVRLARFPPSPVQDAAIGTMTARARIQAFALNVRLSLRSTG